MVIHIPGWRAAEVVVPQLDGVNGSERDDGANDEGIVRTALQNRYVI